MAERPRVKDVVMRTTDQIGDINKKPLKVYDKLDGLMDGWRLQKCAQVTT